MMHGRGKSDGPVVPAKSPNKEGGGKGVFHGDPYTGTKAETPDTAKGEPKGRHPDRKRTAEGMEGRGPAKGNPRESDTLRTQCRGRVQQALGRVRQAAKRDRKRRFTTLMHHIYTPTPLLPRFSL